MCVCVCVCVCVQFNESMLSRDPVIRQSSKLEYPNHVY